MYYHRSVPMVMTNSMDRVLYAILHACRYDIVLSESILLKLPHRELFGERLFLAASTSVSLSLRVSSKRSLIK